MKNNLKHIEEFDLREIFKSEASDFTPWLAENLDQLSERLGIEIVDSEVEKHVGDFRLDIIGLDANSRQVVAIENQLDPSDHTHLGQLITYASGIEAGIVVWIAPEIRQEHQQALNWLNENSDTSFFGIELRVIRIGDSDPAMDFRVRVAPNDWLRGVRSRGEGFKISPRNELYRKFFEDLSTRSWENKPGKRKPKAGPQNWYSWGAGKSGMTFGWVFRTEDRFCTELYIDASEDSDQNVDYMNQLRELATISEDLHDLEWERFPGKRHCRIFICRSGEIVSISRNQEIMEEVIAWGVNKMLLIEETFRDPIKKLQP